MAGQRASNGNASLQTRPKLSKEGWWVVGCTAIGVLLVGMHRSRGPHQEVQEGSDGFPGTVCRFQPAPTCGGCRYTPSPVRRQEWRGISYDAFRLIGRVLVALMGVALGVIISHEPRVPSLLVGGATGLLVFGLALGMIPWQWRRPSS